MFRFGKLIAPLTAVMSLLATVVLFLPQRAAGGDGHVVMAKGTGVSVFGHDTKIAQPLQGDVQVMNGTALVESSIHGDLYVFGGNAVVSGAGHVDGDVVCIGGNFQGDASTVSGRIYAPGFTTPLSLVAEGPGRSLSLLTLAIKVSLLLVWLLAAVVITLASGREVRAASSEVRISPFHSFALGLVAFMSFVLTAIVFSYLIPFMIGIPLLAALGAFAFLTKAFGLIAVFHATGTIVAGARTRAQLEQRKWSRGDLSLVLVGLLILGLLRLIPVAGTIIWMAASIFGVGTALATKFGRREPWFLAWHPLGSDAHGVNQ